MSFRTQLVAATLALFIAFASAQAPDFTSALAKVNQVKPNIDYATFCSENHKGRSKVACRITGVPSVGFLVCQRPDLDGLPCGAAILQEMATIKSIDSAGIKIVKIHPTPIKGVKCTNTKDNTCVAFLEEWVDLTIGWMEHLANRFRSRSNTVDNLIGIVKQKVSPLGLKQTAADLELIRQYMKPPPQPVHNQICDLQGFFLYNGGFVVSDPAGTREGVRWKEPCYADDEPTTEEVALALDKIVKALNA